MEPAYQYDAFISYRHLSPDKEIATKLQEMLETYTPPKGIGNGRPRRKMKLFRDETELPTSNDLGEDIHSALRSSAFLIVICSPELIKSKWCLEEIEYFKSLHGGSNRNILTLLVSPDGSICFPDSLRFEKIVTADLYGNPVETMREIEPLAANISAPTKKEMLKKLKTEYLRIAAPLLGCRFDDLYGREQRRKAKRRLTVAGSIAAGMAIITVASVIALLTISSQKAQIEQDARDLREKQSNLMVKESSLLVNNGEIYESLTAALEAIPAEGDDIPIPGKAVSQIADLTDLYCDQHFVTTSTIEASGAIQDISLIQNGKRLIISDPFKDHLVNVDTGEIIRSFDASSGNDNVLYLRQNARFEDIHMESYALGNSFDAYYDIGDESYFSFYRKKLSEDKELYPAVLMYSDGASKQLQCISPDTGKVMWSYQYEDSVKYYDGSAEESIVVILDGEYLVLAPETGEIIFRCGEEQVNRICGYNKMLATHAHYHDGRLILVYNTELNANELCVVEYRRSNLHLVNRITLDFVVIGSYLDESSIYVYNTNYSLTGDLFKGMLVKIDPITGSELWRREFDSLYSDKGVFLGTLSKDTTSNDYDVAFLLYGRDMTVLNAETGEVVKTLTFPEEVNNMYYSPNGFVFILGIDNHEAGISLNDISKKGEFISYDFRTMYDRISHSGFRYAAMNEGDRKITIYTIEQEPDVKTLFQTNEDFHYFGILKTSPSQQYIALKDIHSLEASTDNKLKIINVSDGSLINEIETGVFENVEFCSDDYLLVTGGDSYSVRMYETRTGKEVIQLKEDQYYRKSVVSDRNHPRFAIISRDGNAELFDLTGSRVLISGTDASGNETKAYRIMASPDFSRLAIKQNRGYQEKFLLLMTPEGEKLDEIKLTYEQQGRDYAALKGIAWSDDFSELYLNYGYKLQCYDVKNKKMIYDVEYPYIISDVININDTICILDADGNLMTFSVENGKVIVDKSINLDESFVSASFYMKDISEIEYIDNEVTFNNTWYLQLESGRGILGNDEFEDAWLIDTERFEVIYRIPHYGAVIASKNQLYSRFYSKILIYPFIDVDEVIARAKRIISVK